MADRLLPRVSTEDVVAIPDRSLRHEPRRSTPVVPQELESDHDRDYNHGAQERTVAKPQANRAIWTRKRFWVAVFVLCATIAIVVGILVSSRAHKQRSGTGAKAIAPESRLAASGYMRNGVQHNVVFWQDTSGTLWQSSWNNDTRVWSVVSLIDGLVDQLGKKVPQGEIRARLGTPLAVTNTLERENSTFAPQDLSEGLIFVRQINLFYLSDANLLQMMFIRDGEPTWTLARDWIDTYPVASYTNIGAGWLTCNRCYHPEVVIVQSSAGDLQMVNRSNMGKMNVLPFGSQIRGTPIALTPKMVQGELQLYLYSYNVSIQEISFSSESNSTKGDLVWSVEDAFELDNLGENISISAATYGYTDDGSTEYTQLFITRPDTTGVWTMQKKMEWGPCRRLDSMSAVVASRAMATTQDGRVFAMVRRDGALKLTEWTIDHAGNVTEVGIVKTTYIGNK